MNRAGECPEGLIGADERDVGFSLPEMGIQGIGVFPEAATDDDRSRRQFARSAVKGDKPCVRQEELVGEVREGMVVSGIVGDGGRGAEVSTDVGSEGRGAGDTILEREDREEVAEGAGEEEEAGDGGDGEETPATAGEGEAHKAYSSYNRGNNQSEWRSTEQCGVWIDAEGLRRKNHGQKDGQAVAGSHCADAKECGEEHMLSAKTAIADHGGQ